MEEESLYEYDNGVCSRTRVYGMEDTIRASKYPFALDLEKVSDEITATTIKLAQSPKGEGHDQFLTGITVEFDLTFSCKAWVEAERYRYLTFISSMSTMHRGIKLDVEDQCNEFVCDAVLAIADRLKSEYNENPTADNKLKFLYNLPLGYRLTARMVTNYRQLKTIYSQRKNHDLPEWREFCEWVRHLPNAGIFITGELSAEDYLK